MHETSGCKISEGLETKTPEKVQRSNVYEWGASIYPFILFLSSFGRFPSAVSCLSNSECWCVTAFPPEPLL